jgi:hypothetical protein
MYSMITMYNEAFLFLREFLILKFTDYLPAVIKEKICQFLGI